ncbi:MAG TPA: lysophospholipid acyltransferase family protein, partial [Treponemataceae bacterium]|nr:lysophospholipid acyltransferase family protein [Treponemataceae bacterium]
PFFLNYCIPYPTFFVTSDALFRNRFIAYWLKHLGCIPKSQAIPDIETIRNIMAVIRRGDTLCLYPEGMQTWDGATLPLNPATARLLKLLKVPVIRVISHGAFSTCPRWSRNRRQGRVTLNFKQILTAEEIRASSVEAIQGVIQRELSYNEWDWLSRSHRYFNNFFGAHGMEKVLYACPSCGSIGSIRGSLNLVRCGKCGLIARFNNKGRFINPRVPGLPENLHEWNKRQRARLTAILTEALRGARDGNAPLLFNTVLAYTGYRVSPMKRYARGALKLYSDRLVFTPTDEDRKGFEFPIEGIDGIAFLRRHIEFYFDHTLYRFRFLSKYGSSLKWNDAIGILKDCRLEGDQAMTERRQEALAAL